MSKSLKKKNHWTNKVHEAVITRGKEGELGFELKGGAENGQFPYFGEVKQGKGLIQSGKLAQDELLLEVNNMPVAGLTTRDVLAVIKHCKDPVRLKCVKQDLNEKDYKKVSSGAAPAAALKPVDGYQQCSAIIRLSKEARHRSWAEYLGLEPTQTNNIMYAECSMLS
uniref:PDZ domain-containing protein n=1 Tax=Dicentrarchus labrax TaxID=13489 RepID=A0A8P4GA64_DICLA